MGNSTVFKSTDINGVHIDVANSHPETDIDEEHFVIEMSPIRLKWTV